MKIQLNAAARLTAKEMSRGNQEIMVKRLKNWGSRYGFTFSNDGGYASIDNRILEIQATPNENGKDVDIYILPSMHIDPEAQEELYHATIPLSELSGNGLGPHYRKAFQENKELIDHLKQES